MLGAVLALALLLGAPDAAATATAPAIAGQSPRPVAPVLPPLVPAPAGVAARRDWLRARFDELFALPQLATARVSLVVTESDSGKVLYARGEKTALNAASNVKLVTSAAALTLLGPEYRWKTSVYGPRKSTGRWLKAGGELAGDLYLRGSGDPTLTTQDLGALAAELAALGLRRVHGALVVDATFFDGGPLGPGYEQRTESAAFRAPSSAASLNRNAVAITVIPAAAAGAPARVVIDPPSAYFHLVGKVITARSGPAVPMIDTLDAGDGRTRVTLGGRVRLGGEPRTFFRRVVHPELFLGHTFRQILAKRGITVDKPVRLQALVVPGAPVEPLATRVRAAVIAAASPPPTLDVNVGSASWRVLATHDSPPLAVVVQDLNKKSSNFAAEQVIRTLGAEVVGRPGNWDKGLEAVARYLESLGIGRQSYRMSNGAGLYDSNRFTAEQIAAVIRGAMRDFRIAGEFLASLAVAGADGTLAQRMAGTAAERYVRAKTGTLATVSCLSGVAGAAGQRPLVFAILVNDVANPLDARAIQDRAAEILVSFLDPPAPER